MDHDFLEAYDKLSDLNEADQLTEKNNLKKAAMAAGLLAASAVGQLSGCSAPEDTDIASETSTSEVSSARSTPAAPDTSGYSTSASSGLSTSADNTVDSSVAKSSQISYADWAKRLDETKSLGEVTVNYQVSRSESQAINKSITLTDSDNMGRVSFSKDEITIWSSAFYESNLLVTGQTLTKLAFSPTGSQAADEEPKFELPPSLSWSSAECYVFENSHNDEFLRWLYNQIVINAVTSFDLELWFEI